MPTLLSRIDVSPETAEQFCTATADLVGIQRLAEGALHVDFLQDRADPTRFTLIENFVSQPAIDAWHASEVYVAFRKQVDPMVLGWSGSAHRAIESQPIASEALGFRASRAALMCALEPVLAPPAEAGLETLPRQLPEHGIGELAALQALAPIILGGACRLDAPCALAHMDPPTPWVSWVTTFWNASVNQNLLHPEVAPVAREIERQVIDWLAPAFGMDGGHMTPGSTVSNLTGLWAARELAGVTRVAASMGAHLSMAKAAHLLGLDFVGIPTDPAGRLDPAALPADMSSTALVLTAGATSTGAIDPLDLAGRAAWTHVDAAWCGPLRLSPRYAGLLDGIEGADSVAISAHKWLYQPKESALILFRQTEPAHRAISFGGAYLAAPNVGILGSHGAVAVPLLATLLSWGREGMAERIDRSMGLAEDLYTRLARDPRVIVFGEPASAVLLWRPAAGSAAELRQRLPVGTSSLTQIDGVDWIRHVAVNPMADIDLIWQTINVALG